MTWYNEKVIGVSPSWRVHWILKEFPFLARGDSKLTIEGWTQNYDQALQKAIPQWNIAVFMGQRHPQARVLWISKESQDLPVSPEAIPSLLLLTIRQLTLHYNTFIYTYIQSWSSYDMTFLWGKSSRLSLIIIIQGERTGCYKRVKRWESGWRW